MWLYLAFVGPYNEVSSYPWNPESIVGVRRFIERIWKLQEKVIVDAAQTPSVERALHKTLDQVGRSIETYKLNTGVAALMSMLNTFDKEDYITKDDFLLYIQMLSPYAPHLAEELHDAFTGTDQSIFLKDWPQVNPELLIDDEIELVVQVNGKVKDKIVTPAGQDDQSLESLARSSEKIKTYIGEKQVRKVIVVKGRLVNIVI